MSLHLLLLPVRLRGGHHVGVQGVEDLVDRPDVLVQVVGRRGRVFLGLLARDLRGHDEAGVLRLEPGGDPANPDDVVEVVQPEVTAQLDMPPEIWQPMARGFNDVPVSGTAAGAFAGWNHGNFGVAGKTGTAEVAGKADTAVFVAWGPTSDPQFAVTVFLEESGFGADSAAPVARWILEPLSGQSELLRAQTVEERTGAVVPECEEPEVDPLAPFATTTTTVQRSVDLYGGVCEP